MIIVVAYTDRGAGNDPKTFFFFFGGGGESRGEESFAHKAQHCYGAQYGSNDLPRPRRSTLSDFF